MGEMEGEGVTVIALTATPPYDSTPAQWERYTKMCGPVMQRSRSLNWSGKEASVRIRIMYGLMFHRRMRLRRSAVSAKVRDRHSGSS